MKNIRIKIVQLICVSAVLILSCEKNSEWLEAELQNTTCNSNLTTVVTYNDVEGTVSSIPGVSDNAIYIKVDDPDSAQETEYVVPCNLPDQYRIENLKILFSGDLKAVPRDFLEPGTEILIIAQPITLTLLRIKN